MIRKLLIVAVALVLVLGITVDRVGAHVAAHVLSGKLETDEHLAELVLHESVAVVERIAERRLRALTVLTPAARERMERTALAFVQMQGNAAAMARALHVHPQTARYRIARLRELLGGQLDDPGARFELEAALRHRLKAPSEAFV